MVKSLPVAAPLQSYEIGSRFGVRGDPMNGHAALPYRDRFPGALHVAGLRDRGRAS